MPNQWIASDKIMLSGQNSAGKVISRVRVHCVLQTSGVFGRNTASDIYMPNTPKKQCCYVFTIWSKQMILP